MVNSVIWRDSDGVYGVWVENFCIQWEMMVFGLEVLVIGIVVGEQ